MEIISLYIIFCFFIIKEALDVVFNIPGFHFLFSKPFLSQTLTTSCKVANILDIAIIALNKTLPITKEARKHYYFI